MFQSVFTKIAGGFAVILLLLLVSSIVSFSAVRSINSNLHKVVDEAAPMMQSSGELISILLEKSVLLNQHQKSRSKVELNQYEADYATLKNAFDKKHESMAALVTLKPELARPFNETNTYLSQYFELVPEVFSFHQLDVENEVKVEDLTSDYEDYADDLDSLVYDYSEDIFDLDQRDLLKAIGNLAREATVTTTDSLNLSKISTLNTAYKDIQSITKSLRAKFTELSNTTATESDYFSELEDAIEQFNNLSVGQENVLNTYITQLTVAEKSQLKLAEAQLVVNSAIEQLRGLVVGVQSFADQSRDSAVDTLESSQITIVLMAIFGVVSAIGISYLVIRNIRSPLNRVIDVLGKLSSGDLTQTIQLKRQDEFGNLANSVRELAERLRKVVGDIAESSQLVATSAEDTASISRNGSESINQQREQTELVATAMAEMSATVSEVAISASNALQEVQSANSETRTGQDIVQQNITMINKLANEIERAAEVIDKLNEYSDNIGSVLDVIRGIADQTNLLALNAAIEAARAGEQGRGFAVVADEVRTLASKTQESTSEIQEMIERLQNGTKDAVNVMQRSQKEAQVSVDQTAKAGDALQSITRAVGVINDMSTHIATSAEEQSAVTNEMHQNITTISTLAEQNAQGATEGLSASQQLANLSEQLNKLVAQFKY